MPGSSDDSHGSEKGENQLNGTNGTMDHDMDGLDP